MKPIRCCCVANLPLLPEEIAAQILDLEKWPEFQGFGVLPGIRTAVFECRPTDIVGTRIRVTNTDGSSHVEEIVEWQPERRLRLHMHSFSAPLSYLAKSMEEKWEFELVDGGTRVRRSLEMFPLSRMSWPLIWAISQLLRRAIARHLRQMQEASK